MIEMTLVPVPISPILPPLKADFSVMIYLAVLMIMAAIGGLIGALACWFSLPRYVRKRDWKRFKNMIWNNSLRKK